MAPPRWDRRRGITVHLPHPTHSPTVPQRSSPARSPHPPPPLPRLPRSGDVSDPVPAAAASSVPARSRRPPSPSRHGFGGADAAAAAAAAASTCHPRAARPRPLRPATRGYAELPAAVPRPLSWSAALAGETHAAPAGGPETSLVGEGLGMRFPQWGTRDWGSSEGERVGNGASAMEVGPSGEGRVGVSSTEASARIGCPSDGDGELLLPQREGWGGVPLMREGLEMQVLLMNAELGGSLQGRGWEGTEVSWATTPALAALCCAKTLGAPIPHVPQA